MSFGFGWALPTLPPLTSRHCPCYCNTKRFLNDGLSGRVNQKTDNVSQAGRFPSRHNQP
jgi:hypothetical protein